MMKYVVYKIFSEVFYSQCFLHGNNMIPHLEKQQIASIKEKR